MGKHLRYLIIVKYSKNAKKFINKKFIVGFSIFFFHFKHFRPLQSHADERRRGERAFSFTGG